MHLIDASNPKNRLYVSQEVIDCMQRIPPIDPESLRPTAEWIEYDNGIQVCSNCGEEHSWEEYRPTYCEDCGARMKT